MVTCKRDKILEKRRLANRDYHQGHPKRRWIKGKVAKTYHATQYYRENFDNPSFMEYAPTESYGERRKESKSRREKYLARWKNNWKTNPVDGFLYSNVAQDIKDGKITEIIWRKKSMCKIIIENDDGKCTKVLIGNVPARNKQFKTQLLQISKRAFELWTDMENKEQVACRRGKGDEGDMIPIGGRMMHLPDQVEAIFSLPRKNPDFRAEVAEVLKSYYDFLDDWVAEGVLDDILKHNTPKAISIMKKYGNNKVPSAAMDLMKLMKDKYLYNLITSRNLHNTVHLGKFSSAYWPVNLYCIVYILYYCGNWHAHLASISSSHADKLDTTPCCTTWVYGRANRRKEDSIVAHFLLPNCRIDNKPVAIKIRDGTFIVWDGRKVWHNTVISKRAEDNDIYGVYTAGNKNTKSLDRKIKY
jgi:hypothetical protein